MSVIALILALVSVISILVAVAYYGQMRYYRALFAKEKKQRKQYYKTVFDQAKRIVDIKNSNSSTITTLIKIEAMREVSFRNQIEELEERVEDHLTCISSMDDQIRELKQTIDGLNKLTIKMDEENRELGQTVIDQGKLILMKDEEINELELGSPTGHLHNQVKLLSKEITNKCNDIRNLRGEAVNAKELLRLAEEANLGHLEQIHRLQAEIARILAEFKDYRETLDDYDRGMVAVIDGLHLSTTAQGCVRKWIEEENELAAEQVVEDEPTASPELCTEMGTKPADKIAG